MNWITLLQIGGAGLSGLLCFLALVTVFWASLKTPPADTEQKTQCETSHFETNACKPNGYSSWIGQTALYTSYREKEKGFVNWKLISGITLGLLMLMPLTGCGVTATRREVTETDFILISKGEASLVYKILGGGVNYCKITKHGIPHENFTAHVTFDGKKCEVEVGHAVHD